MNEVTKEQQEEIIALIEGGIEGGYDGYDYDDYDYDDYDDDYDYDDDDDYNDGHHRQSGEKFLADLKLALYQYEHQPELTGMMQVFHMLSDARAEDVIKAFNVMVSEDDVVTVEWWNKGEDVSRDDPAVLISDQVDMLSIRVSERYTEFASMQDMDWGMGAGRGTGMGMGYDDPPELLDLDDLFELGFDVIEYEDAEFDHDFMFRDDESTPRERDDVADILVDIEGSFDELHNVLARASKTMDTMEYASLVHHIKMSFQDVKFQMLYPAVESTSQLDSDLNS